MVNVRPSKPDFKEAVSWTQCVLASDELLLVYEASFSIKGRISETERELYLAGFLHGYLQGLVHKAFLTEEHNAPENVTHDGR